MKKTYIAPNMKEASMALEQIICQSSLTKEGNAGQSGITTADSKRRNGFFDDEDLDDTGIWK